jgi:hypothetical protein
VEEYWAVCTQGVRQRERSQRERSATRVAQADGGAHLYLKDCCWHGRSGI